MRIENKKLFLNIDKYLTQLQYHGNVCISGLTASGKTTHSHLLAGEFGLSYVSGSQIQFNFMGISPIQPKYFWITDEAKALWNEKEFIRIDSELLRLESVSEGYIFDTSTMPWRHKKPALCIWLESDLESRIIKSIVSHHGHGSFSYDSYREKILEKDKATIDLYKKLYNIDISKNLSFFDLILDISTLIKEPTLKASLYSIATTHSIIRAVVGWYLTNDNKFRVQFENAVNNNIQIVHHNSIFDHIK